MLLGEVRVREELVEILLQILHGRGVPGSEAGDQGVPAAKAGRVIRRQGTCRRRGFKWPAASLGNFAAMFRSLWTWQRYTGTPGKTWRIALRRAGLPSSTTRGAPRGQVVQEHHLDIRALAGAETE